MLFPEPRSLMASSNIDLFELTRFCTTILPKWLIKISLFQRSYAKTIELAFYRFSGCKDSGFLNPFQIIWRLFSKKVLFLSFSRVSIPSIATYNLHLEALSLQNWAIPQASHFGERAVQIYLPCKISQ